MKKTLLLKTMLLLCAFIVGSSSAWAAETIASGTYKRVTNVNELTAGAKVLFVSEANNTAAGSLSTSSSKYRESVTISISSNETTIASTANVVEFTVGGSTDAFTFHDGNGYINSTAANGANLNNTGSATDNKSKWTVTISSGVATIKNNGNTSRYIKFNSDSPRFACYASSYNGPISIYIKDNSAPSYTVNAISNNTAWGTVSLSGSVITGSPKNGYRYANPAYTVNPANSATVSQSGDEFTVTPTADTEVTINFEAIPTHTVTWSINGTETAEEIMEGEDITFPADPADVAGKTFMGWTETTIAGTTDEKPTFVTSATMGTSDLKYYAVYATQSGSGENGWVETTLASLTATDVFVIVGDDGDTYAMTNDNGTGNPPSVSAVTISDGKITSTVADNIKWNISGNATDGYTFYPNGDDKNWLYCTNTNNGVRVGTNASKTFKIVDDYLNHEGTGRYVGIYNSQDWRCYGTINSNISGQSFAFYKYVEGSYSGYCTSITVPVTISDAGYATFSNASAVDFSSNAGLSVYYVSSTAGNKAEMVEIGSKKVPANTGVLLKGAAGNYNGAVTAGVDALVGNLLFACVDGYDATVDNEIYILANGGSGVGFYPIKGGTSLGAGKAYIGGGDVNAKCLTLSFGSETTAINGVEEVAPANVKTRKVVKNGRLVIETANGEFTIDGARVK